MLKLETFAEIIFQIGNLAVLPVWLLMIFAPHLRLTSQVAQSYISVLILAFFYTLIVFSNITFLVQADFATLQGISNLFQQSQQNKLFVVAAWFHYLAFDLAVGTYIFQKMRSECVPHIWIALSLLFTFMLGPFGFLLSVIFSYFFKPNAKTENV
ncbi:MAG: ABA4-like family protein [Microscillaceae bacterium]|nr:ABA4-like family protein [Microscillaceae bacterium]MDW8461343.1 ABA4-like family protein [Cytophagales bacterium]